ncbi:1285_t:CDS:10, partial [Ambispora leptoticha]
MATPEEDFSSLPLTERITHKIWKVRVGAYEELAKKFKTSDNEGDFRPYEGLLKNIATDSNAVAQETGLSTLLAFVENAPNPVRSRASVIPAIVDKGFGSARAGTKNKAVDLILLYIEVDTADPVVEDVLAGLNAKQPKLVTTTVFALKEIIRLYGAKTVNVKPILKTLPTIFNHTDKNVRSEGTNLVIELYKWLGQALNAHLQQLKPIQVKELNEAFEKLPPEKPTQTRLLRSQQAAAEAAAEAGNVDVLGKMSKDFYTQLASTKWKERKEALENLLEKCKTPKIADGNYGELVAALAKRMTDSNILVVTLAANCIEALALGLRDAFAKYKQTVVTPILEKLKERKQSVVDALAAALDAVFLTVTFTDVSEDFIAGGKHKNPQVKTETMKWLVRCLKNTKIAPTKSEIKALAEMMVKSSEDSFEPVRVAAFEGLGTLMKRPPVVSEPPKAKPAAKPPADDAPKKAPPAKKPAPTKKPAPSAAKKTGKTPAAAAPPPAKKGAKVEEPIKYKYTNEEVEGRFAEVVPESETSNLGDKNWKLRLAAIENLYQTLNEMDSSEVEAELVIRFLAKKPGWKESNFQVMSKAFNIIEMLADKIPSFSKPSAALATPILIEKLGDIKLKKSAGDCLTKFCEKISLQFVLSQAYEPLRKSKSPKTLADSLTWVQGAVMEFGITGLQVRELIDFLKFALSSSNAAVRTNAVTVLGALRIYVGPGIRTFIQDLNATQLATIDTEFEKVADQAPPQPTKSSAEFAGSSGGDALEELFPKVDIGAQFTSKMIADCNDDKWKTRKDGLEQIKAIVDANQKIKPNLGDFVPVLK